MNNIVFVIMKQYYHLFEIGIALSLSISGLAVPRSYTNVDTESILSAADGDTLSFEYTKSSSDYHYPSIINTDTVIRRHNTFHYFPKETKKPYYAVFQRDDKQIVSTIYNAKTHEPVEVARYSYQAPDVLVLNGKQSFYVNGKEYYQEYYVNDVIKATMFLDSLGRLQTTFNMQTVDWKYYNRNKAISIQHDAYFYKLTQKLEYYASGAIKSRTEYSNDEEGKAIITTTYFDKQGKKQMHKESNAAKIVQKYLDAHFDYQPIESDFNDIVKLEIFIPVAIHVDTAGVITAVTLSGDISYSSEIVSGYTVERTNADTGNSKQISSTSYDDNKQVEARIKVYHNNIAVALRSFIQQLSNQRLQCTPECIGKVPQSSIIRVKLQRDGMKHYKLK